MSAPDQFPVIAAYHWQKVFDDYRASLWPDEIVCERILIRETDLMHTPLLAKIDGGLWRPVKPDMVGTRVGARRIRRPVISK